MSEDTKSALDILGYEGFYGATRDGFIISYGGKRTVGGFKWEKK